MKRPFGKFHFQIKIFINTNMCVHIYALYTHTPLNSGKYEMICFLWLFYTPLTPLVLFILLPCCSPSLTPNNVPLFPPVPNSCNLYSDFSLFRASWHQGIFHFLGFCGCSKFYTPTLEWKCCVCIYGLGLPYSIRSCLFLFIYLQIS